MSRWEKSPLLDRGPFVPRSEPRVRQPLARFYPFPIGLDLAHPSTKIGVDVPKDPGALVSVTDVRQYIAAIDESATSLNDDQYATLVYDDPDELKKKADLESEYGDASGTYAQVAVLRERAKTRSPEQVAKEEAWGAKWRDTFGRWLKEKELVGYPGKMNGSAIGQWYKIRDLHREINLAHDTYEALGYKATLAKKEELIPSGIPDLPYVKVGLGVGLVAVLVVGGLIVYDRIGRRDAA